MRRRPRPFMLSASTGDGAALVVIVRTTSDASHRKAC